MGNNSTPLAAKYYTDARYFTLDKENTFFRSWQCICHQSSEVRVKHFHDLYRKASAISEEVD